MTRNLTSVAMALLLISVLCALGAAVFTAHALPVDGSRDAAAGPGAQACYTLDTARPEWLQTAPFVYLPVVFKNYAP